MTRTVLYDDGLVRLDDQIITLRRYYFPWAGSKHIRYSDVKGLQDRPIGSGRGRIWGGDLRHWAPLDLRRPRKDTAIVLDLGAAVHPVFTPEDPARVLALLNEHVHR